MGQCHYDFRTAQTYVGRKNSNWLSSDSKDLKFEMGELVSNRKNMEQAKNKA